MKAFKLGMMIGALALLSACADTNFATRTASIDPIRPIATAPMALAETPGSVQTVAPAGAVSVARPDVDIIAVDVRVPRSLKVSEANLYYPKGDIVWREDHYGDRYAQVAAIFQAAMDRGVDPFKGKRRVILDVEVERFHALTEKARFTVGGVHSIIFTWYLKDPQTGQALTAPRRVEADLKGFGGQQAIEAVRRGETQKVRITRHLSKVIQTELLAPGGYHNAQLGFFQAVNKI